MPSTNKLFNKSFAKTILIIVGVVIAIVMSINSPIFTAENLFSNRNQKLPSAKFENNIADEKGGESSGSNYSPGIRLLQLFGENLPYLNNK